MTRTVVIDEADLVALAERLRDLDGVLTEPERVALLTVFELAGEALEARIDEKADVGGFALNAYSVGVQVGVPDPLPTLGDGLLGSVEKGKGKKPKSTSQPYLRVTLHDCLITSY